MFSSEIADILKYYVYRLIDPRNGETFYIGKGTGNRVFSHIKGNIIASDDDDISEKLQRIREITTDGFDVAHVIHRHGMDENTAYEVEAALIDSYAGVTNLVTGRYSDERGVMHSKQVIEKYKSEEIEFHHKVLMININNSALDNCNTYEAVRYSWKIDPSKAAKADYVFAVRYGIVVGIFVADQWLEASAENFPDRVAIAGRYGFIGHEAPTEIQKLYLRKRIPEHMKKRGASNPIRYVF